MCSETQHTWHSLGGDQGNPPAWGCSDANECVDKVKASGRYWTPQTWDGPPPRGAWVGWKYGSNGHAALSNGDGKITTTDPSSGQPTGTEPLDYPKRWGFSTSNGDYTVWTDQYAGVRFDVGIAPGDVYLSKLVFGQEDSDSVRRLQTALNSHSLDPPGDQMLPITGNYMTQTDTVVIADQQQHGFGSDPAKGSSVGPKQAEHVFAGTGNTIIDDREDAPQPPEEVPPVSDDYWYSGKPSGTFTVSGESTYKRLDFDKWAPARDCLLMSMLYLNVKGEGEFKVRLCRDPDDYTAYQTYYAKSGDAFLLTHVWFEMAEAGRRLWWEVACADAGYALEIGTRYCKMAVVR